MLHSTRLSWSLCSCPRSTDHQFLFPESLEPWSKKVLLKRPLSLLVLLPMTTESLNSQRPPLLLWDSLLVPRLRSWRLVVKPSLWINWLLELQRVKTPWSSEVQELPEKLLDTSVSVLTRVRLQESNLPVESSKELEVDVDLEPSRCKQIRKYDFILIFPFCLLASCILLLSRQRLYFVFYS